MEQTPETIQSTLTPDLFVMRHGLTYANSRAMAGEKVHQGDDEELSEFGERQVAASAHNLASLIKEQEITADRNWIMHHSPFPRAVQTKNIVLNVLQEELAGTEFAPEIVEEESRSELAERRVNPAIVGRSYDEDFIDPTHETWYQVYHRLVPYVEQLKEDYANHQLFIVGHGGTNGILRLLLENGPVRSLEILRNDSIYGVDPFSPESSDWYTHKIPNAAIDLYQHGDEAWQPLVQVRPSIEQEQESRSRI